MVGCVTILIYAHCQGEGKGSDSCSPVRTVHIKDEPGIKPEHPCVSLKNPGLLMS